MLRLSSSRLKSPKAFKAKRAIQIFLLITVCIWLFFKVDHTRDKKAMEEVDGTSNILEYKSFEVLKLGRKDLISNGIKTSGNEELQVEGEDGAVEEREPGNLMEEVEEDTRRIVEDKIDTQDEGQAEEALVAELGVSKYGIHNRIWWDKMDSQDTEQESEDVLGENIDTDNESETWRRRYHKKLDNVEARGDMHASHWNYDYKATDEMDEGGIHQSDGHLVSMEDALEDKEMEPKSGSNLILAELKENKLKARNSNSVADWESANFLFQDSALGMDSMFEEDVTSWLDSMIQDQQDLRKIEEELEDKLLTSTMNV